MLEHELLKVDVSKFTEKKQGLTYLSWAHAWAHALKIDPSANFIVHTFEGKPYMDVNGTGMVWVGVMIGGNTRTCWLPIMDHRNKPIQNPDAFQVNTSIMRCLTKCLAMFGLGLNVYAGEDLPLDLDQESKPEQKEEIKERPKAETPKVSKEDNTKLILAADGLIEYLSVQTTESALKSYWKSNQELLDEIKAKSPDLFDIVRSKFTEAKEKVIGKENN